METFLSTGWYHIHLRKFSRYPNSSPYGEQSWKGRIILVDWFAKIVARFVSREKEKIGEFYFGIKVASSVFEKIDRNGKRVNEVLTPGFYLSIRKKKKRKKGEKNGRVTPGR